MAIEKMASKQKIMPPKKDDDVIDDVKPWWCA